MLQKTFLTRLLFGKSKTLSLIIETLSMIPVKKSRLGLPNPVTSTNKNFLTSQRASTELIQAVMREGVLSNADHLLDIREERHDGQKHWDDVNNAKFKKLVADLNRTDLRMIVRSKNTGA